MTSTRLTELTRHADMTDNLMLKEACEYICRLTELATAARVFIEAVSTDYYLDVQMTEEQKQLLENYKKEKSGV